MGLPGDHQHSQCRNCSDCAYCGWLAFEYPSAGSARETNPAFDLVDSQRRGNRASAILITGAAGRVGGVRRRLTELLLNQGITMRAVV